MKEVYKAAYLRYLHDIAGALTLLMLVWSAALPAQTVNSSHPRIWATPQRLQQLKNYVARNTQRWQNVKAAADLALSDPNTTQREYIPPLSVAYQMTGNIAYAQQAIKIMLTVAVPTNDLMADSGWEYRYSIPDVTFGYDWCYSQMTPLQRQQVATWLMDRTDAIWPETNPARATAWSVANPANNYFWGFYDTWPAALAVCGDNTDTHTGSVSGKNRPQYHINLALSKWTNLVRPFTDGWGAGGLFAESTNYDSMFWVSHILDAYHTATGVDLTNQSGFNFVHDSLFWRIYSTVPTHDYYYNLGTQSRIPIGNITEEDRERAFVPRATINDTTAAAYGKFWLDTLNPPITKWWWVTAWEFLYYNEDAASLDYTQDLPPYYFAPAPGLLIRRSDWTPQATYWGIWSGPLQESHQFFDVNGFLLYKGTSWLVGNDSMWSHDGTLTATQSHNNLTFGGLGQSWQVPNAVWPNQAGTVLHAEQTAAYTYFAGWGAQAYVQDRSHGGTGLATDYVRKVAYIAPDTVIIYDRAGLLNPRLPKEWHLHSQNPITINGRSYQFSNGAYQVVGQSLLPMSGVTVQQTPMYLQTDPTKTSSYRLDVVTNNNQATDYLLNVLQVAPSGSGGVVPAQPLTADTGNVEGAICDNWVVLFGKSDLVTGNVRYTATTSAATQALVVDLYPSTAYQVTITNLATSTASTTTTTTTNQGSLHFPVPAGHYQVSLVPPANARGTNPDPAFNPNGVQSIGMRLRPWRRRGALVAMLVIACWLWYRRRRKDS